MAAKKQTTRKSKSRSQFNDLPSMNTEYTDFNSGAERRTRNASGSRQRAGEREVTEILKEFIQSPAVKYVAGGIATALLTRLATKLSDRYPEISTFIRDNVDMVENRINGGYRGTASDSARH